MSLRDNIRTILVSALAAASVAACGGAALAGGSRWPLEINSREARIVVYQPQPDKLEGNSLTGRMAVSVSAAGTTRLEFGVIWFVARLATDRDTRVARLDDVRATKARFPTATPRQEKRISGLIHAELPKWYMFVSIDQLAASLNPIRVDGTDAESLVMAPPRIIFVDQPAVLVSMDGAPVMRPMEHSSLKRVANTAFLIVFDPWTQSYFLDGGALWYRATDLMGLWHATSNLPPAVAVIAAKAVNDEAREMPGPSPESGPVPRIIVVTEPAELIVTRGPPRFAPLVRGQVDYVINTDSDILRESLSREYFLLLSGRWYQSSSLNGPWSHAPSNRLPRSFKKIPDHGPKAGLLAHVAGTTQAGDAVMDAQIPQTSAIRRDQAHLAVSYDGEPRFEQIHEIIPRGSYNREGSQQSPIHYRAGGRVTSMPADYAKIEYAANTSSAVIKVGDKCYCCDQAVWFVSDRPYGPWALADAVPEQIYAIPPDCPLYNVRYVRVYGSDPEAVYVGYTAGYVGSYSCNGTLVYGTGYRYPAWIGDHYCSRPATWGFAARYDPVTGAWGLAAGARGDWFSFGPVWRHWGQDHGWFGPADYHVQEGRSNTGSSSLRDSAANNNIYNRRANVFRNVDINQIPPFGRDRAGSAQDSDNNLFAGQDGVVYRKTATGWKRASRRGWIRAGRPGYAEHLGRRQPGTRYAQLSS